MSAPALTHTTVLLHEAVDALLGAQAGADGHYVDATFGRGGHSRLLLQSLSGDARLTVFDKDPQAITAAHALGDSLDKIRRECPPRPKVAST